MRRVLTMKTTTHFIVMLLSISLCMPLTQAVPPTGQESLAKKNDARRVSIIPPQQIEAELAGGLNVAALDRLKRDGQYDSLHDVPLTINPLFSLQQKLLASDGAGDAEFGFSVALSGDTLVVGARYDAIGGNLYQGSVYVFTRSGGDWTPQQKLTASDGEMADFFGSSVALSGDTLVVGAPMDDGAFEDQGSAYTFTRSGAAWTERQKLIASDGAGSDRFGSAVAVSGHTFVAGASWDDTGSNQDQGSVYVFYRPPCESLALTPASLPNGSVYGWYDQLVAVNAPGLYQFTVSSGVAPPGLTLSSDGRLSGPPTMQGVYQFTITATDLSSPCSISRDYTLTIDSCTTLAIDPPTLPSGMKGLPYNEPLMATGGVEPYVFSKKSGLFPPGLGISADGVISGTPTQTGNFSFTVQVYDSNGCAATAAYSIAIKRPGIE